MFIKRSCLHILCCLVSPHPQSLIGCKQFANSSIWSKNCPLTGTINLSLSGLGSNWDSLYIFIFKSLAGFFSYRKSYYLIYIYLRDISSMTLKTRFLRYLVRRVLFLKWLTRYHISFFLNKHSLMRYPFSHFQNRFSQPLRKEKKCWRDVSSVVVV